MDAIRVCLPFDDTIAVSMEFWGEAAQKLADALVRLLTLPKGTSDSSAVHLQIISSGEWAGNKKDDIAGQIHVHCEETEKISKLWIPEKEYSANSMRLLVRLLYLAAYRRAVTMGLAGVILHGALLGWHDSRKAIALFGPSGMGKSTAAQRWYGQSGVSAADDMLFLFRDRQGRCGGRALPTLSRYPEPVSYAKIWDLKMIFRLLRGPEDRIVPTEDLFQWNVALCNELLFHHGGNFFFKADAQGKIFDICWNFVKQTPEICTGYDIWGDLNGNIFNNIQEFLK